MAAKPQGSTSPSTAKPAYLPVTPEEHRRRAAEIRAEFPNNPVMLAHADRREELARAREREAENLRRGIEPGRVRPSQGELVFTGGEAEAATRARLKVQLEAPATGGRARDKRGTLFDENRQRDMMDMVARLSDTTNTRIARRIEELRALCNQRLRDE